MREDLTAEAIRLGRILRALLPDEPEVAGLLALMLLTEARRTTRVAGGELVPLHEQDRGGWDRALIAEGHDLVRECLATGNRPGQYQLLAAINAVHTDAPDASRHRLVARSRRSTRSCTPSRPARSSRSTARSRSPSSTGPRSRWRRWTGSRTAEPDDLPRLARDPRRPAAAARAAAPRRGRRTTPRSRRPTTRPSAPTSPGGVAVWRHDAAPRAARPPTTRRTGWRPGPATG